MIKRLMIKTLLVTALCLMVARPVVAADLSVQFDRFNNTLTVTNTQGGDVYVRSLVSGGREIPLSVKLNAGASAKFEWKTPLGTVDSANCVIFGTTGSGAGSCSVNYQVM